MKKHVPLRPPDFGRDESGAVTVDFVVITGAIVGLGLAVYGVISGGVENLSDDVRDQLASQTITTSFGVSSGESCDSNCDGSSEGSASDSGKSGSSGESDSGGPTVGTTGKDVIQIEFDDF